MAYHLRRFKTQEAQLSGLNRALQATDDRRQSAETSRFRPHVSMSADGAYRSQWKAPRTIKTKAQIA
jgi:hypothetical protein